MAAALREQFGNPSSVHHFGQVAKAALDRAGLTARDVDHLVFVSSTGLSTPSIDALIANRPQALVRNREGRFQLFRVGDAVASRNIHAALYESLRLCVQF